ncbi:virulence protein RhuM/Fic/DOC family protein [Deferribacteraceae bacterium V6Fe1]|nr:virulence protein RhuM/Fic/DOC family protein [Deferribacteraceae bacterium V6Fe1]
MNHTNQLLIFEDKDKKIEVQLKEETLWLNAHQIAILFDVDRTVVVKHIRNIYKDGELEESITCAKIAQVAADGKKRKMNLYNLDVIIAVGYRVNSKKATQFRIWATNVLKNYLIKGYAINEKRITQEKLKELENTIKFIKENINTPSLSAKEAKGLLEIIEKYALVWQWIEEYDTGKIDAKITRKERKKISYEEAKEAIKELKEYLLQRGEASDIFGAERDRGLFDSALNTIYQSFGGDELYPSFEEKAANLLYLVIKNHPFVDGNKRIGALLFLQFLYENLTKEELFSKFNSNTLTALCYLVAASPAEQKEQLIKLIMNFISFES